MEQERSSLKSSNTQWMELSSTPSWPLCRSLSWLGSSGSEPPSIYSFGKESELPATGPRAILEIHGSCHFECLSQWGQQKEMRWLTIVQTSKLSKGVWPYISSEHDELLRICWHCPSSQLAITLTLCGIPIDLSSYSSERADHGENSMSLQVGQTWVPVLAQPLCSWVVFNNTIKLSDPHVGNKCLAWHAVVEIKGVFVD